MKLTEVRKEDDLYFQGPFWVEGDSIDSIKRGNYRLNCKKYICDFTGNGEISLTHRDVYKGDKSFDYFPRGRVSVYNGIAYININPIINDSDIIDDIIKEYNLSKLDVEVSCKYGDHYKYKLK